MGCSLSLFSHYNVSLSLYHEWIPIFWNKPLKSSLIGRRSHTSACQSILNCQIEYPKHGIWNPILVNGLQKCWLLWASYHPKGAAHKQYVWAEVLWVVRCSQTAQAKGPPSRPYTLQYGFHFFLSTDSWEFRRYFHTLRLFAHLRLNFPPTTEESLTTFNVTKTIRTTRGEHTRSCCDSKEG